MFGSNFRENTRLVAESVVRILVASSSPHNLFQSIPVGFCIAFALLADAVSRHLLRLEIPTGHLGFGPRQAACGEPTHVRPAAVSPTLRHPAVGRANTRPVARVPQLECDLFIRCSLASADQHVKSPQSVRADPPWELFLNPAQRMSQRSLPNGSAAVRRKEATRPREGGRSPFSVGFEKFLKACVVVAVWIDGVLILAPPNFQESSVFGRLSKIVLAETQDL